jgi:hypothetical protein
MQVGGWHLDLIFLLTNINMYYTIVSNVLSATDKSASCQRLVEGLLSQAADLVSA